MESKEQQQFEMEFEQEMAEQVESNMQPDNELL